MLETQVILLLLKLLIFLVISFVLVHFFAIFGVFCAVAYLIFWVFFPRKSFCLFCQLKGVGRQCPFCHRRVVSGENLYPRTLRSVLMNFLLFLGISMVCMSVVWIEGKVLFQLPFPLKQKTVYFSIPAKDTFKIGEIFPMKIQIEGIVEPINLVRADIQYENSILEIVDFDTSESFANIMVQKEIDNTAGYARFVGGVPNPGFAKKSGTFGAVLFKGRSSGLGKVEFLSSSLVLANDGRATNLLKKTAQTAFVIVPESISKEEEKKQSLLMKPKVLGEESEELKMEFYEETRVLGKQAKPQAQEKLNWPVRIYDTFKKVVEKTFSVWGYFLK